MSGKTPIFQILFMMVLAVSSYATEVDTSQNEINPLEAYLTELDEMGRTLSGWKSDNQNQGSWFFGSYAMLLLRNNGKSDIQPYSAFESTVPELWSDFKYLTPRYLVELAGGALSNGDLMKITRDLAFSELRTEEKFILQVAGFSYLRMLQGSIADSLFSPIVTQTIAESNTPYDITCNLIKSVTKYCGKDLAVQFEMALNSSRWADVNLEMVKVKPDSVEIHIKHLGLWKFPVDVLVVSTEGDSSLYQFGISSDKPLLVRTHHVAQVILDPYHKLAEYYRYNNKWPRLKDNVHIQPFGSLPDWTSYRITVKPSVWRDWDDEKRLGLKFTSGFGVDLWPAYPSDYRHRTTLELNVHEPYDTRPSWGGRFSYGHPMNLEKRMFSQVSLHSYHDWKGASIGMVRYIGTQSFLIQGPRLDYQRLGITLEVDDYVDSLVWSEHQNIAVIKGSYTGLSLTRLGDRIFFNLRGACGDGPAGSFSIFKSQVDLSGVFWGWLVGGLQFVAGFQEETTPSPYQFTHNYAWQDRLSAIPNFRGQNKLDHNTNEYMGLSISGGYWLSGFQVKVFTSGMIVDMNKTGWEFTKPHYATGFGFEHTSFFTLGLYFPIWQSHPLPGEESWAWRYQWRLTWNL